MRVREVQPFESSKREHMSKKASRRGFIGSSLAAVAVTPCALAGAETTPAATPGADATQAAVEKAVTECRDAAFDQRMEADAAYGKALVARFGPGVVDTIRELTIARAKGWLEAAKLEKRDLEAVKTQLWSNIGPRFDVRVVADTKTHLQYEVRKCPYAEAMRRHGAAELGFAYSCAFDIGFCQGLNPAMRFTRTKTLMMGDPICDHTYDLPADGAAASGAKK
jgi:hypothetical protein